ncbi:translation initiation factor [Cyanobium sp. FACHB-13342]|uniref:translation initiation factor n=1 Tax=Cyanobium sp. FACHB-13342 TaxID=2692793 RepID=UPI001F54A1CA|nr:translation initiation factor [Cyanobium sp. FACHB-13342]
MGPDQKIRKDHRALATALAVVSVGHSGEEGGLAGNRPIGIEVLRQKRIHRLDGVAGKGGTVKDGVIEPQGDQVAPAISALEQAGYRPKQAGGWARRPKPLQTTHLDAPFAKHHDVSG